MAGGGRKGPDNTPIDAELKRAGGFGRFQVLILLDIVFGIMSVNLLTHGIAILELEPDENNGYMCKADAAHAADWPCSAEEFCQNPYADPSAINYDGSKENLYNWYTKLELVCKPKSATARIATAAMIGIFVAVLIVPRLGDLYGRKPVFWGALLFSIPLLCLVTFSSSAIVVDVGVLLAGPCIIGRMSCGFLMLMEHV